MKQLISRLRQQLAPGFRTSIFYASYWGAMGFLLPFLFVDLNRRGATQTQIGIISTLISACFLIAPPLVSRVADQRRQRVLISAVLSVLLGAALLFLRLPRQLLWIVVGVVLYAVHRAPIEPIANGVVVRMVEKANLSYGRVRLWGSLAFAVIGSVIGMLYSKIGYDWMYVFSAAAMIFTGFIALLLDEPAESAVAPLLEAAPARAKGIRGFVPQDPILLLVLVSIFFQGAMLSLGLSMSSIYMSDLGASDLLIGMVAGLPALFEIPMMISSQQIIRRFGALNAMLTAMISVVFGFLFYVAFKSPLLILLGAVPRGAGFGLYFVSAITFINERAPADRIATYQSFLTILTFGLAPLIFSPLSGIIYEQLSPVMLFSLATGLGIISLLVLAYTRIKLRQLPA
ncbi:MAG: MFS transporter [Anaerolineaceae bacterium]|nr:MFS transporter [Anaerolineaceae bacterium]